MSEKSLYTRSVERAIDVLECFIGRDRLSLHQLAEMTGLPDSTVLRIVNSLRKRQYICKSPETKMYYLGDRFRRFLEPLDSVEERLKNVAYPLLQSLHETYNENVQLFTLDRLYLSNVLTFESTRSIHQPVHQGDRKAWYPSAAGRIFLAYQSDDNRRELDPNGSVESDSITKILEDNYTLCVDAKDISIVGIAAPIFANNKLKAAVQLSGPASRFINEMMMEKIQNTIKAARDISQHFSVL